MPPAASVHTPSAWIPAFCLEQTYAASRIRIQVTFMTLPSPRVEMASACPRVRAGFLPTCLTKEATCPLCCFPESPASPYAQLAQQRSSYGGHTGKCPARSERQQGPGSLKQVSHFLPAWTVYQTLLSPASHALGHVFRPMVAGTTSSAQV